MNSRVIRLFFLHLALVTAFWLSGWLPVGLAGAAWVITVAAGWARASSWARQDGLWEVLSRIAYWALLAVLFDAAGIWSDGLVVRWREAVSLLSLFVVGDLLGLSLVQQPDSGEHDLGASP